MTLRNLLLLSALLTNSENLNSPVQNPPINLKDTTVSAQALDTPSAIVRSSRRDTAVPKVTATKEALDTTPNRRERLDAKAEENKLTIAKWQFWLGIITALATVSGTVLVAIINTRRPSATEQSAPRSDRLVPVPFAIAILAIAIFVFIILPSRVAPAAGLPDRELVRRWVQEDVPSENRIQDWVNRAVNQRLQESNASVQAVGGSVARFETELSRYRGELESYSRDLSLITDAVKQSRERFPTEHYLLTGYGDLQRELVQMQSEFMLLKAKIDSSTSTPRQPDGRSQLQMVLYYTLFAIPLLLATVYFYIRARRFEEMLRKGRYRE